MSNKQKIKCLFEFHDWVRTNTGEYWSSKIRHCKHCKKKHSRDVFVYDTLLQEKRTEAL